LAAPAAIVMAALATRHARKVARVRFTKVTWYIKALPNPTRRGAPSCNASVEHKAETGNRSRVNG
jgi:hypothetical protein